MKTLHILRLFFLLKHLPNLPFLWNHLTSLLSILSRNTSVWQWLFQLSFCQFIGQRFESSIRRSLWWQATITMGHLVFRPGLLRSMKLYSIPSCAATITDFLNVMGLETKANFEVTFKKKRRSSLKWNSKQTNDVGNKILGILSDEFHVRNWIRGTVECSTRNNPTIASWDPQLS